MYLYFFFAGVLFLNGTVSNHWHRTSFFIEPIYTKWIVLIQIPFLIN